MPATSRMKAFGRSFRATSFCPTWQFSIAGTAFFLHTSCFTANKTDPVSASDPTDGLRSRQDPELEVPRHRAHLHAQGHHPLRVGSRVRIRSGKSQRSQVVLRGGVARPADQGGGAGPPGKLAREKGAHTRLRQGLAWREVSHAPPPAGTRRHHYWPGPHCRPS